jgi:hypothetical protein
MADTGVVIESQVLGARRKVPSWTMVLPPGWDEDGEVLRLRDLIERVVRAEVAAFRERQAELATTVILTGPEIAAGAARGKVAMGGQGERPAPDAEEAVATALLAFEDGLYFVFVDGRQATDLDEPVRLRPDGTVRFLRLVAIAGG